MADGSVFRLKRDISPAILRELININDGGKFIEAEMKWNAP